MWKYDRKFDKENFKEKFQDAKSKSVEGNGSNPVGIIEIKP